MATGSKLGWAAQIFSRGWRDAEFSKKWSSFITLLDSIFSDVSSRISACEKDIQTIRKAVAIIDPAIASEIGGGKPPTGGGGPTNGSQQPEPTSRGGIPVINTIGLTKGDLVRYAGKTIQKATAAGVPANYAVGRIEGSFAYLYQTWDTGELRIDNNRGSSADGILWLSIGGKVTDNQDDIEVDGILVGTATLVQQVGCTQGLSGKSSIPGFVRCSLNLLMPYKPLV